MKVNIHSKCWMQKSNDPNLGMWDDFSREIEVPALPRVGEKIRLSFEEDGRYREVLVKDVVYDSFFAGAETFTVVVRCEETDTFDRKDNS